MATGNWCRYWAVQLPITNMPTAFRKLIRHIDHEKGFSITEDEADDLNETRRFKKFTLLPAL
jgi:hypothetical protein